MQQRRRKPNARKRVPTIDVHAHFVPEEYLRLIEAEGTRHGVRLRPGPPSAASYRGGCHRGDPRRRRAMLTRHLSWQERSAERADRPVVLPRLRPNSCLTRPDLSPSTQCYWGEATYILLLACPLGKS